MFSACAVFLLLGAPPPEATAFYAKFPRYMQPVAWSPTPAGLPNVRAATCGACHQEIYAEWKVSTHARAWLDDAQFQEELAKSRKDGDVGWMCENCHTPWQDQLPRLVKGLTGGDISKPEYVANPGFDAVMQLEAIGCATCHVRDGFILGPFGDTRAPHPVKKAPELLTPAVCTQCHQAAAYFVDQNLACVFNTGDEFAASPYPADGKTCQSCHMPEVERPLMAGYPARKTRRHWFGGSLVPKKPEYAAEVAALEAHYPDGLAVGWVDVPKTRAPGALNLRWAVTNAEAGHMLPTGDPERYIEVRAEVRDAAGAVLAVHTERFGSEYRWSPKVELIRDTRLKPKERREFTLAVPASTGPLTLHLWAKKWRISPENFAYHKLAGRYVAGRVFVDETRALPAP